MEQYQGAILVIYLILAFVFAFGISPIANRFKKNATAAVAPHVPGRIPEYKAKDWWVRRLVLILGVYVFLLPAIEPLVPYL